jgi:hypothetical protein
VLFAFAKDLKPPSGGFFSGFGFTKSGFYRVLKFWGEEPENAAPAALSCAAAKR